MKKLKVLLNLILVFALVLSNMAICFAEESENQIEQTLDKNKYIKMGLYFSSTFAREITMTCKSGFLVYEESTGKLLEQISDTSLHFTLNDSSCSGKIYMSANENPDERYVGITTDRGGKLDTTYRDGIMLFVNNGLRVINYLTMEHYLWGVVNKEMNYKFPEEALKAQAVAARTYASKEHHSGFNVCTTTDCQAYGFVSGENAITTQACKDTEGIVACYDGEPINAYFSSSTGGGYTLSLSDGWGLKDVPYLKSLPDEFTPDETSGSPWQFFNTFEELETKLVNAGYIDIGKIQKFEITGETSFGAVTEITVTGSNGSAVIPSGKIMSIFNLKSKFFTIGSKDYKKIEKTNNTLNTRYIMTLSGVKEVSPSNLYILNGLGLYKMPTANSSGYLKSSDVCTDGYVYWYGLGFGHGIGLSQNGAKVMAENGYTFDQILKYYYKDIELVKMY